MTHGIVQAYFGDGKGKSTAASGLLLRALHYRLKIFIVQFLKTEKWQSGEIFFFKRHPLCTVIQSRFTHPEFYKTAKPDSEEIRRDQRDLLDSAHDALGSGFDIVLLDEVLDSYQAGFVSRQEIETLLDRKPETVEIILTGRKCPDFVRRRADLITEFRKIKHPYEKGLAARKGIEF